jgi:hypothetical protein
MTESPTTETAENLPLGQIVLRILRATMRGEVGAELAAWRDAAENLGLQLIEAQACITKLETAARENFATYRATAETCDRLRAENADTQRKYQTAMDAYNTSQEWLLLQNNTSAALQTVLDRANATLSSMIRELKPVFRAEFTGDNPVWACGKLRDDFEELRDDKAFLKSAWQLARADKEKALAQVAELTAANAGLQADLDDATLLYRKTQRDLTDLNAAWHAERQADPLAALRAYLVRNPLHLDGAPVEYHVGTRYSGPTTDAAPDGDERLTSADDQLPPDVCLPGNGEMTDTDARDAAGHRGFQTGRTKFAAGPLEPITYMDAADEINDTGLTNRATDAALRRLGAKAYAAYEEGRNDAAARLMPDERIAEIARRQADAGLLEPVAKPRNPAAYWTGDGGELTPAAPQPAARQPWEVDVWAHD